MANLFRKQAQNYSISRPSYPIELFNYIASKCPGRALAWDVGTGNGQAAVSLSSIFDSVVATDTSPEQLSHTQSSHHPNIRFILTPPTLSLPHLHRIVAPPASVDLITVAQALHWLDLPKFYEQARSVLAPGGVIAAWCYTGAVINNGRADEICRRIYEELGEYWAKERRMVEEGYGGVEFPFEGVEGEDGTGPVLGFGAEREMSVGDFVGYVRSWSAYQTAKEMGVEILSEEILEEFETAWIVDGDEIKNVRFPISLRIGRV